MLQVGVGLRCRDVSALGKYRILCPRLAGWVSGKATELGSERVLGRGTSSVAGGGKCAAQGG